MALLGKLAAALKVPADVLLENDDFQSLLLARELDTKPARLDGGKTVLRPSFPYDDVTRQESFFLDLYISAQYAPEPSVPDACATPRYSPAPWRWRRRSSPFSCWSGTPCGSPRTVPTAFPT